LPCDREISKFPLEESGKTSFKKEILLADRKAAFKINSKVVKIK
jgi:hypothetical protein